MPEEQRATLALPGSVVMNVPIIIPAFRPGAQLIALAQRLSKSEIPAIVIVDDGSGPEFTHIFDRCAALPKVRLRSHPANRGKGAALKTGIADALAAFPACAGVVTADADGQHDADDILRIALALEENADRLILGARQFDKHVPARNRIGNNIARVLTRLVLGKSLLDTQTGLRGVPCKLLPALLKIRSNGYEFELDMLIAAKHHDCAICETGIRTIYRSGNSTHFNPLRDSMKIGFVLFRFSILSLLTALVDNVVFYFAYHQIPSLLASQAVGRFAAVLFNYGLARRAVFLSHELHRAVFPRYILLVLGSGAVSYSLIELLTRTLGLNPMLAKISAESLLFLANFALQRDFVFRQRRDAAATDWTRYYRSVPLTARLTRKYTGRVLIGALKRFQQSDDRGVVVELGGANSCFLDRIVSELRPCAYHVVDMNEYGLKLLAQRRNGTTQIRLHRQDVLHLDLELRADAVFSVGLIEHFDPEGTSQVIRKHFELLKPEGCAVLSFPTPTWLYRSARSITELLGLWNFPDERPLSRGEVLQAIPAGGEVLLEKTLWPLVFTQHMIVIRKPA